MVPNTWKSATIGDIAELGSGTTPSRQRQVDYFDGGDICWVKTGDLNNAVIVETEEKLTPLALSEVSCKVYRAGTLLVAMYGGFKQIGRTGLLGRDAAINQALTAIDLDRTLAVPEYVQQWLNHRVDDWKRLAGSSRKDPNITKTEVAAFPLLLPPLAEQNAIVSVLENWNRGIRQLSDLIDAKVRVKQGLVQQLLTGRRRFKSPPSVMASESIKETAVFSATAVEVERDLQGKSYDRGIPKLSECPKGWKTWRLEELLFPVERSISLRPEGSYQLVTAKRYRAGIVPREKLRGDQIRTASQFETKAGDFLISRRQIIHGACGLVPGHLDGAIVSNEYSCLRFSNELDPVFFEYLMHTRYLQQTLYQSSVGVALEKMIFRIDKWLKFGINLPPLPEQNAIVATLTAVDREIVLLDRLQELLSTQKKGLMQKLLTGQVRVKP